MFSCISNQRGNQHHCQALSLRDERFHQHLPTREEFLFQKQEVGDGGVTKDGSSPAAFWDFLAPVTKPQDAVLLECSRLDKNDWVRRKLPCS